MFKPTLCLDFDGVIHSYTTGWEGPTVIQDPPVPGAIEFLREAVKHFDVCIYSTRSATPEGITAMTEYIGLWVLMERLSDDEELAWASEIKWPTSKPPAFLTIDDRAMMFTGVWPTMQEIKDFKPWNKKQ